MKLISLSMISAGLLFAQSPVAKKDAPNPQAEATTGRKVGDDAKYRELGRNVIAFTQERDRKNVELAAAEKTVAEKTMEYRSWLYEVERAQCAQGERLFLLPDWMECRKEEKPASKPSGAGGK